MSINQQQTNPNWLGGKSYMSQALSSYPVCGGGYLLSPNPEFLIKWLVNNMGGQEMCKGQVAIPGVGAYYIEKGSVGDFTSPMIQICVCPEDIHVFCAWLQLLPGTSGCGSMFIGESQVPIYNICQDDDSVVGRIMVHRALWSTIKNARGKTDS